MSVMTVLKGSRVGEEGMSEDLPPSPFCPTGFAVSAGGSVLSGFTCMSLKSDVVGGGVISSPTPQAEKGKNNR